MFNDFYKKYPRKVAKKVAEIAWKKMNFTEQTLALEAITNHIKYWEVTETQIQFIPHPATWLNQGRYEDELVLPQEPKPKELPLITDQQIEYAYSMECGGNPRQSRFNSYFEMKKFILDQRDKKGKS